MKCGVSFILSFSGNVIHNAINEDNIIDIIYNYFKYYFVKRLKEKRDFFGGKRNYCYLCKRFEC
jgi:hypothetical protein